MIQISDKNKKLTIEEFLTLIPKQRDFFWTVDYKEVVHITVPKFYSPIGKKFCKVLRRPITFQADMDAIGSFIWQRCDGKRSVAKILNELKEKFSDEKNIDQRLFNFLLQMRQLEYLDL